MTRRIKIATLLLASMVALPARGYVRTENEFGTPIAWKHSCVFITPNAAGSDDLTQAEAVQAIQASLTTWNNAAVACGAFVSLHLNDARDGVTRGFNPVGFNRNVVVWLEDYWGDDEGPYAPEAVALTTLTFIADTKSKDDGEILDADIELNGVHHRFSAQTAGLPGCHDLQNTLTHELGHVLGLDHTCYDGSINPRPTDHLGNPIPDCEPVASLPAEIRNATMFNFSSTEDINKRTLEADDLAGFCSIYPASANTGRCEPVDFTQDVCQCRTHKRAPPPLPFMLLCGLFLAWWISRSR